MITKLTPKRERFCQEIVKGKSQSDAYREAFKSIRMTNKQIHEEASKLRSNPMVAQRIEAIQKPVIEKVRVTQEQWLDKMELFFKADVRKMFVGPGQCVEIQELGDAEALLIDGFEVEENFAKVGEKAEHVGYTKKIKLTPALKRMIEFGKVMGWYTEKKEIELGASLEELVMASMRDGA